tara:strand:+ start:53 stop:313 length:261 start_codon:yes stop_codon:yes gene_type:complete
MVNKTKILSDLSKIATDAMGAFSGIKKEIETIVKLRVDKAIRSMKLVKRDEFEALKKVVQKLSIDNSQKKRSKNSRKTKKTRRKRK